MENEYRLKSPEERQAASEEALERVRPHVMGQNEPVGRRLEQFANRQVDDHSKDENAAKRDTKPMSLSEMAKKGAELEKKAEKAGIELGKPGLSKDIEEKQKAKEQEKNKEKEKEKEKDKCFPKSSCRAVWKSIKRDRAGFWSARTASSELTLPT